MRIHSGAQENLLCFMVAVVENFLVTLGLTTMITMRWQSWASAAGAVEQQWRSVVWGNFFFKFGLFSAKRQQPRRPLCYCALFEDVQTYFNGIMVANWKGEWSLIAIICSLEHKSSFSWLLIDQHSRDNRRILSVRSFWKPCRNGFFFNPKDGLRRC